ncbi:MAG: hypothetical protein O6831_08815 [Alphaproteobacteria bacterium]|nr:hypothetical protein [Alphaproteobacteria bacterium]
MSTNPKYQKTDKITVQVLLSTGTSLNVKMFVGEMQRVNDLLNDGRKFIPFEDVSGQLRLLNKSMIITVIPLDDEDASRRERGATEGTPPLSTPEDDPKETPQDGQQGA